jgi:hypothetical protein
MLGSKRDEPRSDRKEKSLVASDAAIRARGRDRDQARVDHFRPRRESLHVEPWRHIPYAFDFPGEHRVARAPPHRKAMQARHRRSQKLGPRRTFLAVNQRHPGDIASEARDQTATDGITAHRHDRHGRRCPFRGKGRLKARRQQHVDVEPEELDNER